MPVKLGNRLTAEESEARIEIIPLIDIMFFLLASFMLVSLSMVNMKSVKVNLPAATASNSDKKRDFVDVSIDKNGSMFFDKKPVAGNELVRILEDEVKAKPNLNVFISGDKDARHGDVIRALDLVRSAGIDRVAFEIRQPQKAVTP